MSCHDSLIRNDEYLITMFSKDPVTPVSKGSIFTQSIFGAFSGTVQVALTERLPS